MAFAKEMQNEVPGLVADRRTYGAGTRDPVKLAGLIRVVERASQHRDDCVVGSDDQQIQGLVGSGVG